MAVNIASNAVVNLASLADKGLGRSGGAVAVAGGPLAQTVKR
jgi:hypothetical protein